MTVGKGLTLTGRAQGTYRIQTADSICDSYGNPRLCNLSRDSDRYDTLGGAHDWNRWRSRLDWWRSRVPLVALASTLLTIHLVALVSATQSLSGRILGEDP